MTRIVRSTKMCSFGLVFESIIIIQYLSFWFFVGWEYPIPIIWVFLGMALILAPIPSNTGILCFLLPLRCFASIFLFLACGTLILLVFLLSECRFTSIRCSFEDFWVSLKTISKVNPHSKSLLICFSPFAPSPLGRCVLQFGLARFFFYFSSLF